MDKEAIKDFILKNSSDTRFYGLFYKEKQLLKQNDLMGFAKYQLKKNKNIFIGSFGMFPIVLYNIVLNFVGYIEEGSILALSASIILLLISFIVLFRVTKEYYSIKSTMNLLIAILEGEKKDQEEASSDSAAILSKA